MKYLQLLLWGLGSIFLASNIGGVVAGEKHISSDIGAISQAGNDFKCPFVFGQFSDPSDCSYYYVCVAGVAVRRKCGMLQHFDKWRKRCMPMIVAICDKTATTPSGRTTVSTKTDKTATTPSRTTTVSTKTGDNFKCPSFRGTYPHPTNCSKYYKCIVYMASEKTCPEKQLFDTAKSSCRPEKEVDCGTRQRPGLLTTAMPTESISVEISEEISTEEVTSESTTEVSSTTKFRPTGPPDHTCDEDDVDCIITDTGDVEDWFICPRDVGSFVHPSSDKLFIFCMNWIPSVKKCGMNLVFSKEAATCIETTQFY